MGSEAHQNNLQESIETALTNWEFNKQCPENQRAVLPGVTSQEEAAVEGRDLSGPFHRCFCSQESTRMENGA